MTTPAGPPAGTPPAGTPAAPRDPTGADVNALAQAGADAAATAPSGISRHELKDLIREAVREEAEERNLKGVGKDEADMIGASVIGMLEARGAFNAPPPTPATPPVTPPTGAVTPPTGTPADAPATTPEPPPAPEERPHKKTWAERMIRGDKP